MSLLFLIFEVELVLSDPCLKDFSYFARNKCFEFYTPRPSNPGVIFTARIDAESLTV